MRSFLGQTVLIVATDSSLHCNYIFPADVTWFEKSCCSSVSPAVNKMIKEHGDLFSDSQCKVCSAALISESQKLTHYQVSASWFPAAVLIPGDLTYMHTYQHKGMNKFTIMLCTSTWSWLVLGSRLHSQAMNKSFFFSLSDNWKQEFKSISHL